MTVLLIGLVVLNLVAIPLVVLFATGVLVVSGASKPDSSGGIAELDPASLVTPTGRRLDVREFGGFVFEVTRIMYGTHPQYNSVTITVPGSPPRQGVFRIGDSFAGGEIRVVDITPSGIVLEHAGQQETFLVDGADPSSLWSKTPAGTQIIPARNLDAIPNLPVGHVKPPQNPIVEDTKARDEPDDEPAPERIPEGTALEDLPIDEPPVLLSEAKFRELVTTLPDLFESGFVVGQAFDLRTRAQIGTRILRVLPESIFAVHGIRAGDDIVLLNDTPIHRPIDLLLAAKTVAGSDELRIVVWRGETQHIFTFLPSARID